MLGAIIGDIIGSRFEFDNHKDKEFILFDDSCFFTDDTLMTIAIGKALHKCHGNYKNLYKYSIEWMQKLGTKYPDRGYGSLFSKWLKEENPIPYQSYGNGAPMRVSCCGIVGKNVKEVIELSHIVTSTTHNHKDALEASEAVALSIFFAKQDKSMSYIKTYIQKNYYDLAFTLNDIRDNYQFNETALNTTPQALVAFFESTDFEDAIRNAISIGGDSDTIAAITGSIAGSYYGIPEKIKNKAYSYLNYELKKLIREFNTVYKPHIVKPREKDSDTKEIIKNSLGTGPKLDSLVLKAIKCIDDSMLKSIRPRAHTITSFLKGSVKSPFYYFYQRHQDVCGKYPDILVKNVDQSLQRLIKQQKAYLEGKDYVIKQEEYAIKHELDHIFMNREHAKTFFADDLINLTDWNNPVQGTNTIKVVETSDGYKLPCNSREEVSVINKLSKKGFYIVLRGQALNIPYFCNGKKPKKYYPDLVMLTHDHKIAIIEVKQTKMMSYFENIVKYEALKKFCEENGFIYTMCDRDFITFEDIKKRKVTDKVKNLFYKHFNKYQVFNKNIYNEMIQKLNNSEKKRIYLDLVSIIIKDQLKNEDRYFIELKK